MKNSNYFRLSFLIVGTLTILEFIFVRGMFTWLIAVTAVTIVGIMNMFMSIKDNDWAEAGLYLLATVALCMGYLVII